MLAAATYLAAWAFGTRALYPAALGLALVVGLGWVWVLVLRRPITLASRPWRRRAPGGRRRAGSAGGDRSAAGPQIARRRGRGRPARRAARSARPSRRSTARGSTCFRRSHGAATASRARARSSRIRSGSSAPNPRPAARRRCSSTAPRRGRPALLGGRAARHRRGGRLLMRRTSGFDLHSVRDYQEGESLRKVHWKTTARRGRLMVKELEDTPHDEVAVLLDADAGTAVADKLRRPGAGCRLDLARPCVARQARAAGSDDEPPAYRRVTSFDGEWELARELLAAVEPTGTERVEAFLARLFARGAGGRARRRDGGVVAPAGRRARGANACVPARLTRAGARRPGGAARPAPASPQRDRGSTHRPPTGRRPAGEAVGSVREGGRAWLERHCWRERWLRSSRLSWARLEQPRPGLGELLVVAVPGCCARPRARSLANRGGGNRDTGRRLRRARRAAALGVAIRRPRHRGLLRVPHVGGLSQLLRRDRAVRGHRAALRCTVLF